MLTSAIRIRKQQEFFPVKHSWKTPRKTPGSEISSLRLRNPRALSLDNPLLIIRVNFDFLRNLIILSSQMSLGAIANMLFTKRLRSFLPVAL